MPDKGIATCMNHYVSHVHDHTIVSRFLWCWTHCLVKPQGNSYNLYSNSKALIWYGFMQQIPYYLDFISTYIATFIKLNSKKNVRAYRQLCWHNNSATIRWTSHAIEALYNYIATLLLSGLKPCMHACQLRDEDDNTLITSYLKVIFIIVTTACLQFSYTLSSLST